MICRPTLMQNVSRYVAGSRPSPFAAPPMPRRRVLPDGLLGGMREDCPLAHAESDTAALATAILSADLRVMGALNVMEAPFPKST